MGYIDDFGCVYSCIYDGGCMMFCVSKKAWELWGYGVPYTYVDYGVCLRNLNVSQFATSNGIGVKITGEVKRTNPDIKSVFLDTYSPADKSSYLSGGYCCYLIGSHVNYFGYKKIDFTSDDWHTFEYVIGGNRVRLMDICIDTIIQLYDTRLYSVGCFTLPLPLPRLDVWGIKVISSYSYDSGRSVVFNLRKFQGTMGYAPIALLDYYSESVKEVFWMEGFDNQDVTHSIQRNYRFTLNFFKPLYLLRNVATYWGTYDFVAIYDKPPEDAPEPNPNYELVNVDVSPINASRNLITFSYKIFNTSNRVVDINAELYTLERDTKIKKASKIVAIRLYPATYYSDIAELSSNYSDGKQYDCCCKADVYVW